MSKKKKIPKNCPWCGEDFDDEEAESPRLDADGSPICDDCYQEHYEWTCDRCQEYHHIGEQHIWIAIHEEGLGSRPSQNDLPIGIYEIVDYPYYGGSVLGGHLFTEKLRKTPAKIDWERDEYGYPSGHICKSCANELKLRHSKKGKVLHTVK